MQKIMRQRWWKRGWLGVSVLSIVLVGADVALAQEPKAAAPEPASAHAPTAFPARQLNPPRPLDSASMEDLLLEKGVITLDDWIRIKAEEEQRQSERVFVAEFTSSPSWYKRLSQYGYGMMRYTNTSNGKLRAFNDASVGDAANGAQPGFFFRRIRWVLTGQVSDHVSVFVQPDFASGLAGNTHSLTMRDAFGDWNFDKGKEFRLRAGLQRVPCSFDNWQASRVRMAIERADATNSCQQSERDLGLSLMWTPKIAQPRYKQMAEYMYGPGDYGVFHIAVWNGQGLNRPETNADKHVGARLSWPWELPGGYLMETGLNVSRGQFMVERGTPAAGTTLYSTLAPGNRSGNYLDERANVYIYFPPQPFGFIAEYTTGRGPQRGADGVIRERALYGGYVQGHYQWKYSDVGLANAYVRWQEYYGGVKNTVGAPDGRMKEVEIGIAWEPDPQWEFTVAYSFTERLSAFRTTPGTATVPGTQLEAYGNLLRTQIVWFFN